MKINKPILLILSIIWFGCDDKSNNQNCSNLLENDKLVLCEGSFNNNNASLWSIFPETQNSETIHYEELGDVAQSMVKFEDKLYVILNNSHKIEIYDLDSKLCYNSTLVLENSSPRYFVANGSMGYVSSWNLEAILVFDLNTLEITDTIQAPGIPENLLINNNVLYASVPSASGWSADTNLVVSINLSNNEIITEYNVINGPHDLKIYENHLYVTGSIFTAYPVKSTGISKINLVTKEIVTQIDGENTNIKKGLSLIGENLFRTTSEGLTPVLEDLTLDFNNTILGGTNISFASVDDNFIYFTETDYSAPDTMKVTTHNGDFINEFILGIAPKKIISLTN